MKLRYFVAGAIALTATISVLGAVIGPAWRPREIVNDIVPTAPETDVHTANPVPVGTYEIREQVVDVDLGGVTVRALVRSPKGLEEDLSAVVFMHGAGTHDLTGFADQAAALTSAGIVTVVPDKGMANYTTAHRDYQALAVDYGRSVTMAAGLPGVTSVGIYAESEGAYSAPILATTHEAVDFVVLISPPVVPARQQAAFATDNYLRNVGVPSALLRTIPRALGVEMPFGTLRYADFDPQPYQQEMTQPTFLAFGTGDQSMPLVQATEQLRDDLAAAGNDALTVRFYADANHGMKLGVHEDQVLDEGFAQGLSDWIRGLDSSAREEPRIAGAQPHQTYAADPLPHVRWFLSGNALVVTHGAALVLFASGATAAGVQWLVGRNRRRAGMAVVAPMPRDTAWLLGGAGVLTLAAWGAFGIYIQRVAYLAFNYLRDPAWTYGAYTVQQIVAFAAAAVLAAALISGHLNRDQIAGARRAVFGTTAGGTLALLVLLAYWGGFPDITGGAGI